MQLPEWAEKGEGTILAEGRESDSVRWTVVRGPFSLVAYAGVPKDHPLAGWSLGEMPLRVPGGLTYSAPGHDRGWLPAEWWWYGWDYGHAWDVMIAAPELRRPGWERITNLMASLSGARVASVEEVATDAEEVARDLHALVQIVNHAIEEHNVTPDDVKALVKARRG